MGTSEIHFHETSEPQAVFSNHFAVEIPDWTGMLAHLDTLGIPYSKPGMREYNNSVYTYLHDPDNNMIELVHHPLGLHWAQGPAVASS